VSTHLLQPGARRLTATARREAILDAAKPVFGALGYHLATTREIASAAGVSEALLYQHFPGKRQLFEAVINRAAADLERRMVAAEQSADPMAAAVRAYFEFVAEESALYRVFFREALGADPAFQQLYFEISGRLLRLAQRHLEATADKPARPALLAHALAGMVGELALWWVEDRSLGLDEVVARAARMGEAMYRSEVEHGS
jgi:AcrR family transcriptional regulator